MSLIDAERFVARLQRDEQFRREVEAVRTADQFWSFVADGGYEFTREEYLAAEDAREDEPVEAPSAIQTLMAEALSQANRV